MRFWCLLNSNPINFHLMFSVHVIKIINYSNSVVLTYVIELFPVEVNYLRFEHFGFGCYQAVKVHSWTRYLWVDLAKFFRQFTLRCDEENSASKFRRKISIYFHGGLSVGRWENVGGIGVGVFDVVWRVWREIRWNSFVDTVFQNWT